MSSFTIGTVIEVNVTNCIECAMCVPECPVEAIKAGYTYLDVDGYVVLKDTEISISPEACVGCGDCISVCPTDVFSWLSDNGGDDGGDDPIPGPNPQQDPCAAAAQAAAYATELSESDAFKKRAEKLPTYNDGNEHGYVLGSENGNIVPTDIQHGGPSGINLTHDFTSPVASNHLHPNNTPPSVGDAYSLMNSYNAYSTYSTYYVTAQNGSAYALVVTNPAAMNQFLSNYPSVSNPPYAPNFPAPLNDEYNDVAFDANTDNQTSYEIALAYMLDKYNTGLALLKKGADGNFHKLGAKKDDDGGGGSGSGYSQTKC
ncbi:4Fe-4S binding protein [Chryseobacterium taiwanense]|uniref:4Fe-4S binding protein n=1 Tax=Chryseobacterium taiwanense TaxID=363331 RepID=UPI000689DF2C|nr:4Fe-4S dicluster domain-containing protein [Chryseobacterium taiwanense]